VSSDYQYIVHPHDLLTNGGRRGRDRMVVRFTTTGIVIVKANTNGLCNEGKTFYYVKRNNQKET
jgi:hypothetical protein